MSKPKDPSAFKIKFTDEDTAIEMVEQEGGGSTDGVIFLPNQMVILIGGRGTRLTIGSRRDAGALLLAALSMHEFLAAAEQRAGNAMRHVLAGVEAAGNA